MRGTIRRINIPVLGVVSALMAAAALLPGPAAAAAPANNLLKNVAYYTVNGSTYGLTQPVPSTFCRWAAPQNSVPLSPAGTASQSRNTNSSHAGIGLSITGATAYADDGFYVPLGTLGSLGGYTVLASSPFSTNLWFDTNTANDTKTNGDFFSWSGGCLTTLGGDSSSIGPASTATTSGGQSVTVTGSSTFMVTACPADGSSFTLAQLQAGSCTGITSSTLVAVWIGITAGSGGSLSTTITSATTP